MIRNDRESRVLWRFLEPVRHDVEVSDDGSIDVWTRETAIYRNPKIAGIYEMQRLNPKRPLEWLAKGAFPADALTRHTEVSP